MRKKLITKIILSYLVLIAVAAPVLWLYLSGTIKGSFIDRIEEGLRVQADLMARDIGVPGPVKNLETLAAEYKELTGSRVTIIGPEGDVLADSDEDAAKMENHLLRPEVQAALADGRGSSIRYSKTLGIDMLYVAVRYGDANGPGFVRLSMPLHQVEESMSVITGRVTAAALVIFLVAIVMGILLSRHITDKVAKMAAFTKKVAAGDFSGRLRPDKDDELGALAGNLTAMAEQLSEKIDAITREKTTLEAVLGGMAEGVLVTDKDGRVILANRSLREAFGISRQDALGRPFLEVIRNSALLGLIRQAHDNQEVSSGEVEVQFPGKLNFTAGCVPIIRNGKFAGAVLVLHDVTRVKALERVRRDFVANVTHELKTPISAIQGFSETLLSGALEDRDNARRFLGIIEASAKRLARLIEDLLTLSKIELGEMKFALKPVSLMGVAQEAAALLEPKSAEKLLSVNMEFPDGLPRVMADRDKLYQIVLNVLDNAVKFTPEGGTITLAARTLPAPAGGEEAASRPETPGTPEGMVELSVSDTGQGIPPDMLTRIGERFFRVDAARSRELGGTGLGLAIVKHLVNAHGGSFDIDSYPGKGTTVNLSFRAAGPGA